MQAVMMTLGCLLASRPANIQPIFGRLLTLDNKS